MKKIILTISAVFCIALVVNAQEDLVNKKGFKILPEAGDFALGFDAIPVVDFALNAVNIMNNTGQTGQHPGFVSGFNNVIVGKYFLDDLMAARFKIAINTSSSKTSTFFDNPAEYMGPGAVIPWYDRKEIEDIMKTKSSDIILGGGVELRRGHNRLQGFYGGELLLGFSSSKTTYEYAVVMDQIAVDNGYVNGDGSTVSAGRTLSTKSGMGIMVGARGFVGAEYFFAPKISLGAEFGWGVGMATSPRGVSEVEFWKTDIANPAIGSAATKEIEGPSKGSSSGFGVDDGINQGLGGSAALTLMLHF